jgi:hypothetical protein
MMMNARFIPPQAILSVTPIPNAEICPEVGKPVCPGRGSRQILQGPGKGPYTE